MHVVTIHLDTLCGGRQSASIEIHRPPVSQSVPCTHNHPPREVYNCHSAGVYYVLSYLHRVSRAGGESHGKRFKDAPAAELQRHRVRTMGVVVPVIVLAKVCGQ